LVGVVDAEVESGDLPASSFVDEDRFRTEISVDHLNTAVQEAKAFQHLTDQPVIYRKLTMQAATDFILTPTP